MARAFQTGLKQLWREQVLGRYLRGEISRDKAMELAGIDWVELAERQHKAMMEDLEWALEKALTVNQETEQLAPDYVNLPGSTDDFITGQYGHIQR